MSGIDMTRQLYIERAHKCAHSFLLNKSDEEQNAGQRWEFVDYPMQVEVSWLVSGKKLRVEVTMLEDDMVTAKPAPEVEPMPGPPTRVAAAKKKPTAKKKAKAKASKTRPTGKKKAGKKKASLRRR